MQKMPAFARRSTHSTPDTVCLLPTLLVNSGYRPLEVRVVVAPEAQVDIVEAYNSVAEHDPEAADPLLARVIEIIGLLAANEFVGREVVLRDGRRVRPWPIPPYRLYYREREDAFEVVRVYHQSRRPIERRPRSRP